MKKIGKSINLYNEEDMSINQSLQIEDSRKIDQSRQISHLADQSQALHGLVGLCHVLGGHAVGVGDELLLAPLVLLGLLILLCGGHAHGRHLRVARD
jgi:hypothetical protein